MALSEKQLRGIPQVNKVLSALGEPTLPRPLVVQVIRQELQALRKAEEVPAFEDVTDRVRTALDRLDRSRIRPVINGTGVIVHTNLGRSPLPGEAVDQLAACARSYNNLEFDLPGGKRGKRGLYLERVLALLCRAPAATVVNNCASALVLMLRHFTAGTRKEVVISRGELIQIGGGFRIPDIMETSGAVLREVGTTNRTSLDDYARAIGPNTALILKVHRSNFFMEGFVASPDPAELAALGRRKRVPVAEDLGSGALVATDRWAGIAHEPTPAESLKAGNELVCFSGDKLLGGPQAGIVAGKASRIRALKKEPFFRALRCDKLVLSALQATAELYLHGEARDRRDLLKRVPTLELMQLPPEALQARAEAIAARCADLPAKVSVGAAESKLGGGTMPQAVIPSVALKLSGMADSPARLAERLRHRDLPVIGTVAGRAFHLDLRTVFPDQDGALVDALRAALAE